MKFRLFSLFLALLLNFSCSDSTRSNKDRNEIESRKKPKTKPASTYSDTIKIIPPAAVFYTPDTLQLEKIKAITDPMIFESTIHDCFYQMRFSRLVLKQHYAHVKIIDVKKASIILFEKRGNETEYFDLNAHNDPCGIVIYDGQKPPRLVDMTNIESELGFYFKK